MEQIYFGQRIAGLRKAKCMTQESLAQKLGVTNQAVSKWESDQCCPDIMQLPGLADIFEISLDELFGREAPQNPVAETVTETVVDGLPWEDNNDLHAVCYVGHRLVSYRDVPVAGAVRDRFNFSFSCFKGGNAWASEPVQLAFSGTVGNIYSDFTVVCTQSQIQGSVKAGDSVTCEAVGGDVRAGDSVTCGDVGGDVQAGDSVTCGNVGGSVSAGDSVTCAGNIGMNAQAGDDIRCEGMIGANATVGGDLECGDIGGRVQCDGNVECRGSIGGDVRADGDVQCSGDIHGNVDAEGDVNCTGSVTGNATAEGNINCGNILGSACAGGDIRCSRMGE